MDDIAGRCRSWVNEHRTTAAVFAAVTALLVVQRFMGWNWDFMVYMMNGEYLLGQGSYIEWYRGPVAGLFLGLFRLIVPRPIASVLFVVGVSALFFQGARTVAARYDLSIDRFYVLLVSPFVIMQGTFHGTEMLALAFGMLFIGELNRPRAGLWLALAFLTRYTFAFAVPLVLVQWDLWRMVKTYILAAVPVLGWFGFNWYALGDPLTSVANSVALNVRLRGIVQSPDPLHFLFLGSLSLVFVGYYLWKNDLPSIESVRDRRWLVLLVFATFISLSYLRTPVKPLRYLYPFAFPVAAAGAKAWDRLDLSRTVLVAVVVVHLIGGAALVATTPAANPAPYQAAAEEARGCQTSSNIWPHLSYAGTPAEPVPDINGVRQQIEDGYRVVLFLNSESPPFVGNETLVSSLPTVAETDAYIVAGYEDRCLEPEPVNSTYFTFREERLEAEGIEEEYEPCRFLLGGICRYLGL